MATTNFGTFNQINQKNRIMDWKKYFEMMIDWKKLPAYKAEPRIDSLVGFYLEPMLCDFLETKIIGIIPEFPLRLGTIYPKHEGTTYADRSYKVDFLAIEENGKNHLIEFKTDNRSIREKQNDYLERAQQLGTEAIINGVLRISKVSHAKPKYDHLLSSLQKFGLLDSNNNYTGKNSVSELLYIIPAMKDLKHRTIDFKYISNWLNSNEHSDAFEKNFSKTLMNWYFEYAQ